MSWQVYVDSNLLGTGKIHKAAILGLQGGIWAKSSGYDLTTAEQKAVINAFKNAADTQANGVRLGGQKFIALQCGDEHIHAKKGADGCILFKTKQAILVTEYGHPVQAPEATPIVAALADYLKSVGY